MHALLIGISTFGILIVLLLVVKISGLRSFAKMSSIDFATTIAIGSVLASSILTPGQSFRDGCIAIICILAFQNLYAYLTRKYNTFDSIVSNSPLLLMQGSTIIHENLKKENISLGEIQAKLREANVLSPKNIQAVVLETTGDISVLHGKEHIDDFILGGVKTR